MLRNDDGDAYQRNRAQRKILPTPLLFINEKQ